MSRHEGVSCDNCLKSNFEGKRFKCLICYDYDLCDGCHSRDVTTSRHSLSHPMQCILTRNEFDLYYGGETISPESPPSFVCPFCAKLGFTETLLQEHVTKEHEDAHNEVVCPVCAALPSGDPNLVTEDLAQHLSVEHRTPRDVDDPIGGRHIRRMFYPGRGMRTRTHRNMHFSGGPVATSAIPSPAVVANNNNTSTSSSSLRDSMDPIAELLSQLSGVRRSAQQLQQNVTTASQLQELQTQLQLERQRAAEIRQQLERFPGKLQSNNATSQNINVHSSGGVIVSSRAAATNKKSSSAINVEEEDDPRYLLSNLDDLNLSESEKEKQNREDVDRSLFVQELLLSMLATDYEKPASNWDSNVENPTNIERAIATDCPLLSSTPTHTSERPGHSEPSVSKSSQKVHTNDVKAPAPSDASLMSSSSDSNNESHDTGMGNSVLAEDTNSPTELSVSASDHGDGRREDVSAVSSRSAPTLSASERRALPEAPQWHYGSMNDDDEKDSDEDQPPSPTPSQQRHGLRLTGRVFASGSGPVRLAGAGPINDYGRDDVASGSLHKNIR